MGLGESLQIGASGHGPVFVEDLDEYRGRLEPGQAREVAAGFGMAGAGEHAAGLRHQWKDVTRLHEIRRRRARPDRGKNRGGAVRGRDARLDSPGRVDGDGELRALRLAIVVDHQLQADRIASFAGHRQADQTAPEASHEVDRFRRRMRGRHDEIALVLAVLVVDEHDHVAVSELGDELVDGIE